MNFPIRGEVVGVDFSGEYLQPGDDRVVVWVAVPGDTPVGHVRVVLLGAEEFERSLPTADDVLGILAEKG